ncbi:putative pumilio homolog 7, chloroplastic isoform X2 [Mangifera indica]|nr:putative pumilio homolog 7, chloroplastic isoform X2 [Mangifera indica]
MLLEEIPQVTSLNLYNHHHHVHQRHHDHHDVNGNGNGMYGVRDYETLRQCCASPVSGFSLQSDGSSSSSLFSNGHSLSDNGSPPPPDVKRKYHLPSETSYHPDGLSLHLDLPIRKDSECLIDEMNLCRNLGKMYLSNEQNDSFKDIPSYQSGRRLGDCFLRGGSNQMNSEKYMGFQSPVSRTARGFDSDMSSALSGLEQEYRMGNLLGLQMIPGPSDALFSHQELNESMSSHFQKLEEQPNNYSPRGTPTSNLCNSFGRLSMNDALFCAQRNGMHWNEERGALNFLNSPQLSHPRPHMSVENILQCRMPQSYGRTRAPSNIGIPQSVLGAFSKEDSYIIQGNGLNYLVNKGLIHSRGQNNRSLHEIGVGRHLERSSQLNGQTQMAGIHGNARIAKFCCPFSPLSNYNSLVEARSHIYFIAKDQHGCRFLQKMFDEGSQQDVQIIFDEIIDHVVELMMNPFGNYLMQKLLEVCNEEQRMQILLKLTEEPGELVRISLNTYGTRVVQKLIETLKTREQILLVISALEPGFRNLIKDLNGNHVVQRCLQCFTNEDNSFIFVAAAKYCVEIATHQHGCCVLQRCISHSSGEYRENLVAEISANGLRLAEDAFGNYVVQFILELEIPSAIRTLISEFEGNYVHLSIQKFSSHVVEKCLHVFDDESRSRIIHELLSASPFEQLLQDPHANYVIQTALRVSEGSLHNSLVETIESRKAISRNSPYSKRIFSQKLLKK